MLKKLLMINNFKKIYIKDILAKWAGFLTSLISFFEEKKTKENLKLHEENQPIFIIGTPRCGSTIVYQILSNNLDVLYFNNLSHILHKNILASFSLSKLLFKNNPHKSFKSNTGNTKGLNAPSECHLFWYRFLPKGDHYLKEKDIKNSIINKIQQEIFSLTNKYKKSLLIKNLPMGMRLEIIKKFAPNAKLIFIKRDIRQNAYSIIKARKKKNIQKNEWWSVKPKNYKNLLKLEEEEKAIAQIYYINNQIKKDLKLFPKKNIIQINYSEFINNTDNLINEIKKFINCNYKTQKENIYLSESINNIPNKVNEKLTNAIQKYDK